MLVMLVGSWLGLTYILNPIAPPPPHTPRYATAAHRNGKYDLEAASPTSTTITSSSTNRTVPVFLASPTLGLGVGLRKGARVRFWNVHPVVLGGRVQVRFSR